MRSSPSSPPWSTLSVVLASLVLGGLGYICGRSTRPTPLLHLDLASGPVSPPSYSKTRDDLATAPEEKSESTKTQLLPWEDRWRRLSKTAASPARDRELAALLEELARTDPKGALARAAAEGNWRLRDTLRDASLRGWASVAPEAAGNWALALRMEDRRDAVAAVLAGAAKDPEKALLVALNLCKADPEPAGDYGHAAIAALIQAGAFEAAVKFGQEVGTEKYPFLLKSAFYQWSQHQPDKALAAANTIADPALRGQAYAEVVSGWARADAKSLAEYALTLPTGESRKQALAEALPHWVEKDPVTATEWINHFDAGPDFDDGAVAVANLQTLITHQPAKAMEWAGTISDPVKRSETMQAVFGQWAQKDPAAARHFVETTSNPKDRSLLARALEDASPKG